MKSSNTFLHKLERVGVFAEDLLLLTIVVSMILLAGSQIFLRNIFDYSIFWGDEVLRMMVLWLTLAAGLAASRADKQIRIEVLGRFMPVSMQRLSRIVVDLFTAGICALLSWHSARFVMSSYEYADTLLRDTPAWMLQIILPLGFGLMAWRHLVLAVRRMLKPTVVHSNL
jgi:TRAP-type C4-dicarboxylate transport system permease small subunit